MLSSSDRAFLRFLQIERPLDVLLSLRHRTETIHLTNVIRKYKHNVLETIETSPLKLSLELDDVSCCSAAMLRCRLFAASAFAADTIRSSRIQV